MMSIGSLSDGSWAFIKRRFYVMICLVVVGKAYFVNGKHSCINYSDAFTVNVENGSCSELFKNMKVYGSTKKTLERDRTIIKFRLILKTINSWSLEELNRILISTLKQECKNNVYAIMKLVAPFFTAMKKDLTVCMDKLPTRYLCLMQHSLCFENNENISGLPCYDTCMAIREIPQCKPMFAMLDKLFENTHLCPESFKFSRFNNMGIMGCNKLQRKNQSAIEKCQNVNIFWTVPEVETQHCYRKTGVSYAGIINTTERGKACMPWSIKRLPSGLYPTLVKNYCRNPQDYGLRPWCYIDENGGWEYCGVPKCTEQSDKKSSKPCRIFLYVSVPALLLFIFSIVFYMSRRREKRKREECYIKPYDKILLDENCITKLINVEKCISDGVAGNEQAVEL